MSWLLSQKRRSWPRHLHKIKWFQERCKLFCCFPQKSLFFHRFANAFKTNWRPSCCWEPNKTPNIVAALKLALAQSLSAHLAAKQAMKQTAQWRFYSSYGASGSIKQKLLASASLSSAEVRSALFATRSGFSKSSAGGTDPSRSLPVR